MSDHITRALAADGMVSVIAISSAELCEKARRMHKTMPTATAALGRTLSAASMMGAALKVDGGSVTLQIKGGGPLGTILAVSGSDGCVRGYVQNPGVAIMEKYQGKLDVGAAVGRDGLITVIKDLKMREPYIGCVALVSGEIAEDVTAYFAESEQIPTACALGVLVGRDQSVQAAGGYIIQLMPGADDELISRIEQNVKNAGAVTQLLAQGIDARELIERVLRDMQLEVLETIPVEYRCYCSRQRVSTALISMGADELTALCDTGETAEIECQFCDTVYRFEPDEIRDLLAAATR